MSNAITKDAKDDEFHSDCSDDPSLGGNSDDSSDSDWDENNADANYLTLAIATNAWHVTLEK